MTDAVPHHARHVHSAIQLSKYREHLRLARRLGYSVVGYDEVATTPKCLILRHDIDIDLHCAVEMARVEHEEGVAATYFLMLHNELYNVASDSSRVLVHELADLGHTVGLHFDPTYWSVATRDELHEYVRLEVGWLSKIAERPIKYVSFHQPTTFILDDDFEDDLFVSVYNRRFTKDLRYIADSMGGWREEAIDELLRSGRSSKIQFLSHPALWCNEQHSLLQDRLSAVVQKQTQRQPSLLARAINDSRRNIVMFEPNR